MAGYELLYRGDALAGSCVADGDTAASRTITDALLGFGLDTLTSGALAFVNFTRPLLLNGAALLLPRERVVVELREDIAIDEAVVKACRDLQRQGYAMALDDFTAGTDAEALLPYASYVKIDVQNTPDWPALARRLRGPGRLIVAERVERHDVVLDAQRAGCTLFQGFYFCRPVTFSARAIPAKRQAYLNLFASLNRPDLTIAALEDLVKRDVSLTVRVLRSINSAAFALEQPITSVRQALVLLGIQQVRRWASVWAMAGLSAGSPPEVITVSLLRARMCEQLGGIRHQDEAGELFLLGLCSTLDVILDQPLELALSTLPTSPRLRAALLGDRGDWRALLDLVIARERGYWTSLPDMLDALGLSDTIVSNAYAEALEWTSTVAGWSAVA